MAPVIPGSLTRWALCTCCALLPAAIGFFPRGEGAEVPPGNRDSDLEYAQKTLKDAGIAGDGPGLLKYFRERTLSDQDRARLAGTVRQLGSSEFRARKKAYRTLLAAGRSARPFLKTALTDPDPEIARAAERLLTRIETGADLSVTVAAAQVLGALKPEGTVGVLLAYLPQVDEDPVQEAVLQALEAAGIQNGKVDPLLVEAARAREPRCRLAAATVLGKAAADQRPRLRGLLNDEDPGVRFRAAHSLLHAGDKAGMDTLLALLGAGPMDLAWQVEDLLARLAGDQVRATLAQENEAGRRQWREAWEKWWQDHRDNVDLARLQQEKALRGLTIIVEHDGAGKDGQGRIWECGRDGKVRWELDSDLGGPLDVQPLSPNRILVGEYNRRRVLIRDVRTGKVEWQKQMTETVVSCQQLPNGHIFIATFTELTEVDRQGKPVFAHKKPASIYYARMLPNKHVLYANSGNQIVEVDATGKEMWSATIAGSAWGSVEKLANGRYLVALYGGQKVVEVDRQGKIFWECPAQSPTRAWRLPNGNTLIGCGEGKAAIEYDRSGKKQVWTQKTQGRVWALRRY